MYDVEAGIKVGKVARVQVDFFFFQAEDGIRDADVTGVQTCALPILGWFAVPGAFAPGATFSVVPLYHLYGSDELSARAEAVRTRIEAPYALLAAEDARSEERRVGKECRSRRRADGYSNEVEMISLNR